jgi:hypothetical protein
MKKSLKKLMGSIIDYAGLFPPAELSLDTSIRKYAAYRKSDDAWMLSRFIIPGERLHELESYHDELFEEERPFRFSVLGKATDTLSDYEQELLQLIDFCRSFNEQHGDRVTTEILEIKLPKEAVFSGDADLMQEVLDMTSDELSKSDKTPDYVFYEGYFEESWRKDISTWVEAISEHNQEHNSANHYGYAGFKLRCGGVDAHMFPEVDKVAHSINITREHSTVLKCTAGLHHPIRHYNDTVKTKMHGFINVFGGAMLAYAHDLNDDELEEILKEEDADQFSFTEEDFRWKDLAVSTEDIEELREVAVTSFGSCSFDEPREDLEKLNLL